MEALALYHLERSSLSFEALSHLLSQDLEQAPVPDEKFSRYLHIWYAGARGILDLAEGPRQRGSS